MFEEDFDLERYWIANDISPDITGLPVSLYLFIDAFGNSEIPRLSIIPDIEKSYLRLRGTFIDINI